MQESKYLVANERDALWGLTVSTVGYDKLNPGHQDALCLFCLAGKVDVKSTT